ncbi:MAG: hypothetical protein IPK87_00110 [Planctomycetes bacterium]|nr:hypothetical protein [Planctomycetota bacterium]
MALQCNQLKVPHRHAVALPDEKQMQGAPVQYDSHRGLPGSSPIPPYEKGASSSNAPLNRAAAIPTETEDELDQAAVVDLAWVALKVAAHCRVTVSELRNGKLGAASLCRARIVFALVCTELTSLGRGDVAAYLGTAKGVSAPEINSASSSDRILAQTIATALVKERRRAGVKP